MTRWENKAAVTVRGRAGEQVIDRFQSRPGRLAPGRHLDRRRFASESKQPVSGHMSDAVDQNINLVVTDEF